MRRAGFLVRSAVAAMALLAAPAVWCDKFPSRPVRLVTSAAGGSSDFVARILALGLGAQWGSVIVDNRGSALMGDIAANASPDGHTLLLAGPTFWAAPFFSQNLAWDPIRDFAPVGLAAISPNILVVHPTLPAASVKELIALAAARPDQLNYGTGGAGSTPHLAAELFKSMAKVSIVRINYKGGGPATTALLGGEVQLMFATASSATPHVKSGRLRALAVTTSQPSPLAPGLPTVAASGLPGYESMTIYGVFAPVKIAAPLLAQINQDMVRVLARPDIREKMLSSGVEAVGESAARLLGAVKAEMSLLRRVAKDVSP